MKIFNKSICGTVLALLCLSSTQQVRGDLEGCMDCIKAAQNDFSEHSICDHLWAVYNLCYEDCQYYSICCDTQNCANCAKGDCFPAKHNLSAQKELIPLQIEVKKMEDKFIVQEVNSQP